MMQSIHLLQNKEELTALDIHQIMQLLPHRYPMLLVDKMKNIVLGESALGIKNVTANEPFFSGHFPQKPVMPGVLIIEAMAQTAGALVMLTLGRTAENTLVYFMSIQEARFRKPVEPGDTLKIQIDKKQERGNVWKFSGEAFVEGSLVAEATYTAMISPQS
jgi:3-hydroxyacyl-[acyl-carrier-protein] dehydratase